MADQKWTLGFVKYNVVKEFMDKINGSETPLVDDSFAGILETLPNETFYDALMRVHKETPLRIDCALFVQIWAFDQIYPDARPEPRAFVLLVGMLATKHIWHVCQNKPDITSRIFYLKIEKDCDALNDSTCNSKGQWLIEVGKDRRDQTTYMGMTTEGVLVLSEYEWIGKLIYDLREWSDADHTKVCDNIIAMMIKIKFMQGVIRRDAYRLYPLTLM